LTYGATTINGKFLRTGEVESSDGSCFIDLDGNTFRLGDSSSCFAWNNNNDRKLRIKGTIVQSESGDENVIGVFRGVYNSTYTYYQGDEVTFTSNGGISTYRYIYSSPTKGNVPTSATYWQVIASNGTDGAYYVNVYRSADSQLATPTGTTIPPSGWNLTPTDPGTNFTWMSQAKVSGTGTVGTWSTPIRISGLNGKEGVDGTDIEFIYKQTANGTSPSQPSTSQTDDYVPNDWKDEPTGVTTSYPYEWICVRKKENGIWSSFSVPALWAKYGQDGSNGTDGAYYEYRYAKNGSTTSPPTITVTSANPSGWTTSMPSIGALEYLWMTVAKKNAGGTLLQNWSTPVRTTGDKGDKGDKGDTGPGVVFRGEYSSSETYYGTSQRVDVVKYNDTYYVARVDAGNGFSDAPTNTSKWNTFGAQFESIATKLLLAEGANIAGWVFRNGRLESQSGHVYLDGVLGSARLKGIIQLSTSFSGNISDSNIFYLPAQTSLKTMNMGYEDEDIGKVVRLINSGNYSNANYMIYLYTFGVKEDGSTFTIENLSTYIKPQEVLELTCFELPPSKYSGTYSNLVKVGKWYITGRFAQEDFRSNLPVGRFPRLIAMGRITGTDKGASISYTFYDGRTSDIFSVTRTGTGVYSVSWSSGVIPSGYFLMLTGFGANYGGSSPLKGTVWSQSSTSFIVHVSDDASENDGSCNFMIFAPGWEYDLVD
jgi:hypothetical protein